MDKPRCLMVAFVAITMTLVGAAPSWAADGADGVPTYVAPPTPLASDEELNAPGAEPTIDVDIPPTTASVSSSGPQTVSVPGTRGSEYWLTFTRSGLAIRTWSNYRWSWSWMWYMKPKLDSQQAFVSGACAVIPTTGAPVRAACALAANLFYIHMRSLINQGLATKRCLQYKIPVTSFPTTMIRDTRFYLVTCRH